MKTRAITGVVFVIVLVASLLLGPWMFSIFFALIALFSLNEFYGIINDNSENVSVNRVVGLLLGAALFGGLVLYQMTVTSISALLFSIPFMTLVFWTELFRKTGNPFGNIAFSFLGIIYAVVPFAFFYLLGFIDGSYNYQYPLGFLIMLWASDTGAYLAGRTFGKTKLFERHSPKKTWEGSIGGLVISLLAAFILSRYFVGLETWQWMVVSAIIVVFGTYGDLTESMLKRSYNIKDSGNILPGHGGFLDRFDGLLLSAPLVYLFLVWVG
ncbi:phosphatidate cytidylyltransferase [Albibacterium indicum]|uniref:phosphatidate cytidylyltransferase n=1 Tax=Albibacterium indicum TaxID=2292082 RepID=UPI000E495737|nr:phosphatidate cytidylyltransferase [Pedobacter indicus]